MSTELHVPVLITGAGLAGLSTATFLGMHGTPSLVVERHANISQHPKARGQMPYVMEALRAAGLQDRFLAASPRSEGFAIRIAENLTGPVFQEIVHDTLGHAAHLTPAPAADASQENAERILAARTAELGGEVRFGTELTGFEQHENGVLGTLTGGDRSYTVHADYLVAADGHRSPIREWLGIGTHGAGTLSHSVHWLIRADLSDIVGDRQVLYYMQNPQLSGGGGVVVSTDQPDRFLVGEGFDSEHDDLADFQGDRAVRRIRRVTGIAELEPEILECLTTRSAMRVADRFSSGRVYLAGDAAHTMPPQGGQGGNLAIMDGFHLAWKLAAVLRGEAGAGLLDSHDPERREVGDFFAENQYKNAIVRGAPHLTRESDTPPVEDPDLIFFGYRQRHAVVGEPGDEGELLEYPNHPSGRPGSRAPHVTLTGPDGELSTRDLFGREFVVLTESAEWADAAVEVAARLDVRLTAYQLGTHHLFSGAWTGPYRVRPEGAVLVRPDGFLAWRSQGGGCSADLEKALRVLLDR